MFQILNATNLRLSLRAFVAVMAVALFTLSMACGGDDDGDDPTSTSSTEASPDDSGDATTRTPEGSPVTTPGGTEGVPAECTEADAQRGLISHVDFSGDDGLFSPGEEIEMTQTVINCGGNETILHYTSTQRYDITIENADTAVVVWNSSDGKSFDQVVGEDLLETGDTRLYTETWDQKDSSGDQVPSGNYKVSFFNVGCGIETQEECKFGSVKDLIIE